MAFIMRDWLISALKTALVQKLPLVIGALAPILASVLLYFRNEIAPHLADPTGWRAFVAITMSAALLPLPFAAYFWFRPKFKHRAEIGAHENVKTGAYFCSKCLVKEKIQSPLSLLPNGQFWRCSVCNASVKNTGYQPPAQPAKGQHSWMR